MQSKILRNRTLSSLGSGEGPHNLSYLNNFYCLELHEVKLTANMDKVYIQVVQKNKTLKWKDNLSL